MKKETIMAIGAAIPMTFLHAAAVGRIVTDKNVHIGRKMLNVGMVGLNSVALYYLSKNSSDVLFSK